MGRPRPRRAEALCLRTREARVLRQAARRFGGRARAGLGKDLRLGLTPMKVLSVFGVRPARIGGVEVFVRELSRRLGERDCESIVCYQSPPEGDVRRYL